jgi:hypothetical protein
MPLRFLHDLFREIDGGIQGVSGKNLWRQLNRQNVPINTLLPFQMSPIHCLASPHSFLPHCPHHNLCPVLRFDRGWMTCPLIFDSLHPWACFALVGRFGRCSYRCWIVDYLPFSCRLIFSGLSWMSAVSTGVGFGSRIWLMESACMGVPLLVSYEPFCSAWELLT